MLHTRNRFFLSAGLLTAALICGGEAAAQCSGGGGGRGMRTGSPSTIASSSPYAQSSLASRGYSQNNLLAMQYQQQAMMFQRQLAYQMYLNGQQQQLAMTQRESKALTSRLARAEAKRAARAKKIAARLLEQEQGRSSDDYTLTSVRSD